MSSQILALSKAGHNVLTETDPNGFIFHSSYNCFKIVASGSFSQSLAAGTSTYTVTHSLGTKNGFYAFMYLQTAGISFGIRQERVNGITLNGDGTINKVHAWQFDVYCTTTTLEFSFFLDVGSAVNVQWYIFDNHS